MTTAPLPGERARITAVIPAGERRYRSGMNYASVCSRAAPVSAKPLRGWWDICLKAWRKHRLMRQLAALDERALKDIGIERSDSALAARVRAYRELKAEQARMARLGLM